MQSNPAAQDGYRLSDSMLVADVGDESVILAVESSKYFSVKGAMRTLLEGLRDGMRLEEMVDAVCTRFDVSRADAERDVSDMIPRMLAAGVIVREPV